MTLNRSILTASSLLLAGATLAFTGCGSTYRPVVNSINPTGPASQPMKYAVVISDPDPQRLAAITPQGVVTQVDFSGDSIVNATNIAPSPRYLLLNGGQGYTLHGADTPTTTGAVNGFAISTSLIASQVTQSTLLPNSNPKSVYAQGTALYIAEGGRAAVGQFQTTTSFVATLQQELPTGPGTVYTIGSPSGRRAYALSAGDANTPPHAAAIEIPGNTVSASIPVGLNPVYGVMLADAATNDARRAFVLNKGSNTVSVINAQKNALDTFTTANGQVTGTIPVGVAPVWADLVQTRNELVVANAGDGVTPGSVTIISVPLCSTTTVVENPNCDPANPVDGIGFGTVLANVPVGVNPVVIGALADGTKAYVANAGNAAAGIAGSVSVVDLTTNTVVATIPAGPGTLVNDSLVHGHPNFLAVTTGSPTGKVYVTSPDSTDLTVIRTETDVVQTHIAMGGFGVQVRMTTP